MIGSPQNNFQTMQPAQTMPQPRNVMLGNAMQNMPKPPMHTPSLCCIENYIWEHEIGKCMSLYSIQMK